MSGHNRTAVSKQPPKTRRIDGIATDLGTREFLCTIAEWLRREDVLNSTVATVELVLAEATNNIIEHAYTGNAGPGVFWAELSLLESDLEVALCDLGRAFPEGLLPSGDLPDLDVALEQLPEGGFGWFLIYSQTKSVHYTRETGQNTLLLSFELGTDQK
ncbi:Serine-protein kinase RsbW [Roseovarius albus]|uniref:Serine-protein kinase RsbW n=1 Tax=Roseovarius albus TaxID=1247867 RepID=A0A1X6YV42_9RHOB|nr:ATP-binding protein [Roseovarius albus]SLN32026.1 Serine-protein kinase RsbW [Roseovarius albus]